MDSQLMVDVHVGTCSIIPSMVQIGSSPVFWFSSSLLVLGLDLHVVDSGSSQGLRVFFAQFSVSGKVVGILHLFSLGSSKVSWLSKGIFFVLSSFHLGLYSGALKWVDSSCTCFFFFWISHLDLFHFSHLLTFQLMFYSLVMILN